MAKRKKNRTPLAFDPFGAWEKIPVQNTMFWRAITVESDPPTAIWVNRLYQVLVYRDIVKAPGWPVMHWLAIKRRDKNPIHDWRDLQRIKNDLIGQANEAIELYPAESRLVDTSNQFHLWVLADPTLRFPFGYQERAIVTEMTGGLHQPRQRPWPKGLEPADAMTIAEYNTATGTHRTGGTTKGACPTCGGDTARSHICGAGRDKDKKIVRFPLYTDRTDQEVSDVGGPAAVDEGDQ